MSSRRSRHQEHEPHENHERWLITYADLITLLMVFFVVMYSMGRTDAKKFGAITQSLERAFNIGVLAGTSGGGIGTAPGASQVESLLANRGASDSSPLTSRLQQLAQLSGVAAAISVMPHPDGLLVRVAGNLLFDSGKADLKPEGLAFLDSLADSIAGSGQSVRIEGHSDNVPIDSVLYPSNWELSTARAVTVLRYLSEYGGLPAERLSAVGFAEYRPVASNATREGRTANRRVDIIILAAGAEARPGPVGIDGVPGGLAREGGR